MKSSYFERSFFVCTLYKLRSVSTYYVEANIDGRVTIRPVFIVIINIEPPLIFMNLRSRFYSRIQSCAICTALTVRRLNKSFVKAVEAFNTSSVKSAMCDAIVCTLPFLQVTRSFLPACSAFRTLMVRFLCLTLFFSCSVLL